MTKHRWGCYFFLAGFLTVQTVVLAQQEAPEQRSWTFYDAALDDQPSSGEDFAAMSIPEVDEEEVLLYFECNNGELSSSIRGAVRENENTAQVNVVPMVSISVIVDNIGRTYYFNNSRLSESLARLPCAADF